MVDPKASPDRSGRALIRMRAALRRAEECLYFDRGNYRKAQWWDAGWFGWCLKHLADRAPRETLKALHESRPVVRGGGA